MHVVSTYINGKKNKVHVCFYAGGLDFFEEQMKKTVKYIDNLSPKHFFVTNN